MEISTIIPHIEALIFASEKPLTTLEIVDLVNNALGFIDDRANLDQVETAIDGIREKYAAEFYAFELKQIGGGWQFLTKKEYHKTVAQLNGEKFLKRLSVAALETLAIIAYKQPITKSEIENIRGVNCDYAVQKLLEKELVIIAGRNEHAVGKPLIYTTSKSFMDYFGINSPDDLPRIKEVLMEEMVEATRISSSGDDTAEESEEEIETTAFVVNEQGEIIPHAHDTQIDEEIEENDDDENRIFADDTESSDQDEESTSESDSDEEELETSEQNDDLNQDSADDENPAKENDDESDEESDSGDTDKSSRSENDTEDKRGKDDSDQRI